ncbi:MAG TPA: cysteine-rich CWC family protein [Ramlibacter sp.]|nr:cysteine-rich CWC family protein [Ramlibacter sp.]
MPEPIPAVDPNLCPLCGSPNTCAMEQERESGQKQPPCWCTTVDFSVEVLSRVPPQAQLRACICRACAQAERAA